jgi:hypothetical protein
MVLKAKKVVRSKTKAKKKTVSKPPVKKKLVIRKSAKVVKKKAASKKTSRALKPEIRAVPEFVEHLKHISEETKYYTGSYHASKSMPAELPFGYGDDKIVICVRDPLWVYSYWELTLLTLDNLKKKYGNDFYNARKVLRVYDVTGVNFDGKNYNRFFDIDIAYEAGNRYINTAAPGRSWCVDLGFIMPNGEFVMILRSNIIHTPLDGPSWITDEEWMIPEEMFARLYGMGFGFGKSSPGRAWQEKFKKAFFSGILSSPGMASMASPTKKLPKERKFWLVVNTELIVYGATEPDAKVTVQGKEIKLRPDGTFSLRFALPDGKQTIPVKATSSDKEEERVITPIVLKETK